MSYPTWNYGLVLNSYQFIPISYKLFVSTSPLLKVSILNLIREAIFITAIKLLYRKLYIYITNSQYISSASSLFPYEQIFSWHRTKLLLCIASLDRSGVNYQATHCVELIECSQLLYVGRCLLTTSFYTHVLADGCFPSTNSQILPIFVAGCPSWRQRVQSCGPILCWTNCIVHDRIKIVSF